MKLKTDKEVSSFQTFSMSVATLERIDSLLKQLHNNWYLGDILLIQRTILSLYKELYPFLKDNEKNYGNEISNKIRIAINFNPSENSFNYISGTTNILDSFDFWIREQLHSKGLLMSRPDNPEMAISQM